MTAGRAPLGKADLIRGDGPVWELVTIDGERPACRAEATGGREADRGELGSWGRPCGGHGGKRLTGKDWALASDDADH